MIELGLYLLLFFVILVNGLIIFRFAWNFLKELKSTERVTERLVKFLRQSLGIN
jgi:hypothetical protein